MTRSRVTVVLLLVLAPVILALPMWVCWCHPPDGLDLGSLSAVAPLDPAGRSLVFGPGLPFGSDIAFASQSALNFISALREGVIYPRWSDSCNRGFGAPTFIFYPPLPYYAVAAASIFTADVTGAFRIVLALAGLLAGLSFYHAARDLVAPRVAALGAALYVLAPFHALDLYDRFAFASFLAYTWLPLIFLYVRRLVRGRDRRAWYGLALVYAGLVLTHLVSAFLVLFVLVPYAAAYLAMNRRWRRLVPLAGAGLAGLAVVAVYVVPLLAHRGDVHLDWVVEASYGDWHRNFAYRDEVALGYSYARIKPWVNRAVTVQVLLTAVAGLAFFWRRRRSGGDEPTPAAASRYQAVTREAMIFLGLAVWTLFLQIPLSTPLWAAVPELGTVQFPWRFGTFQALAACMLVCCALSRSARQGHGAVSITDQAVDTAQRAGGTTRPPATNPQPARRLIATALVLAALPAFLLSARITLIRYYIFTTETARRPVYFGKVMFEYIPHGVEGWREFRRLPTDLPPATLSGPGAFDILEWTTHARRLRVITPSPTTLNLRTFDFPGWTASLDGRPLAIDSTNPTRMITVPVPAGEHEVGARLGPTGDRTVGAVISFAAVATMLGFVAVPWLRTRRRLPH